MSSRSAELHAWDRYLAACTVLLDRLIRRGLVLPADRAGILALPPPGTPRPVR
jgi:hypothetical protein